MTDPVKRRDFIKTLSLASASIAMASPVSANVSSPGSGNSEIKNEHFTVSFDKKKGTINIYQNNTAALLTAGMVCVNSDSKRYISAVNYNYTFDSKNVRDQNGAGKKLIILCKDKNKKLDAEIRLSLYDNLKAITIEVICKNVSLHNLSIKSIEPLRVIKSEGGVLNVPGVTKCITNGEMYYDTGVVHEFGGKD